MKPLFFLIISFLFSINSYSQCGTTSISSLIPNPSFESRSCCPSTHSQMSCANSWIQASSATTDYLSTCGYRNVPSVQNPPSPIPNGTSYVGFYDGRNNASTWKEYLGACLTSPLLAGTSYTLNVSMAAGIGSGTYTGVSDLTREFVIFGSSSCSDLPFTGSSCPSGAGWSVVTSQTVTLSSSSWTTVSFTFTPTSNIYGFVFGGNCSNTTGGMTNGSGASSNYYFMDNMILNTTTSFTPPTANAGSNKTTTCTNPSQILNGSASGGTGPYTYRWSPTTGLNNANLQSPSANPGSNRTYTLTVTDANNCTDTDQVLVSVNKTAPTANAGPNLTTTCTTPTATLNGSGGGSYAWNNGASNVQNPTVNPNSTTTYTLTVTGSNGCTDTDQATVTVNKTAPTANAGPNQTTTCTSPTAVLNGSGGGSYVWNNGASNVQNPTVNPASTTTYTLTVRGSNGCTDTDQATVTVNKTAPTANAGSNVLINCANTTGAFTANGVGSYSWNTPSGVVNASTINVDNTSNQGAYTLTVTGANGCTDTDAATLTIDQTNPIANAGSDQISNCATPTVSLDGSASSGTGISYSWSGPSITAGGSTNTASANQPGTYTLTVTGANFCTDTDDVVVNPDTNFPNADAGQDQILNCSNTVVTMDGSNSDSGPNITYQWTTSGGNIVTTSTTSTINADLDGTYTLAVTNNSNGCTSTDNVLVTQDTVTPIISLNNQTATIDCNNPVVTFDASSSSGTGNTFQWTTNNGNIVNGANNSSVSVDSDGIYSLLITSANGCSNLNSLNATALIDTVSPVLSLIALDTLTCNILEVIVRGESNQSGLGYSWFSNTGNILGPLNNDSIVVDLNSFYTLEVTAPNGCTTLDSIEVIESNPPQAGIIANPTLGEVPLDVEFLNVSQGEGLTYFWDFGNGVDTSVLENPEFTYEIEGEYSVILIVEDQYGCIDTDTIMITANELSAVVVPNIFSPNGDGKNEIFKVVGGGINTLEGAVFNRWGQKVFSWDTAQGGWDGRTLSGEESANGTYFYVINILFNKGNSETYKGSFVLVR